MAQGVQIGKVAEQTGLNVDTIRFYQKIGLVKQPSRSEGGFRLFTDVEIKDLLFIQKAKELGFSLTEIKQLSILNQEHGHACSQVRDLLKGKLNDVREKASQLLQLEAELNKALRKCNRDLRSNRGSSHDECCPVLEALGQENTKRGSRRFVKPANSRPRRRRFPVSGVRSSVHLTGREESSSERSR